MLMPAARVPTRSETNSATVKAVTITVSTANFCRITDRRDTGPASTRSSVPASSSPATARAPMPIANDEDEHRGHEREHLGVDEPGR